VVVGSSSLVGAFHRPASIFERRESSVRSYCRSIPATFVSAEGSTLTDERGRRYIDFLAGCASLNYGHNDPDMKAALIAHIAGNGLAQGLDLHTAQKRAFLEALERIVLEPRGLPHRVQFTGPTGANAVEAAMKLARKVTGRTTVVAFTNGYHGVSTGALAATGNKKHRAGAGQPLQSVYRAAYDGYFGPDIDTAAMLDQMLSDPSGGVDAPAAFLLEAVQGEGGLNAASPAWLREIAAVAKKHGALLIVDEIQAGCGRSGGFFGFDESGIVPDLVTLSKSISGFGLPLSLLLIAPEHDQWLPAQHNGTFRGNTHAFVTGTVALEKFWRFPAFALETARRAGLVRERLARIAARVEGARLKGRGMMQGVDVGSGALADRITAAAYRMGLIIETSGAHDEVVKVLAPLTTPDALLMEGFDILDAAVTQAQTGDSMATAAE
jgi:diaminobutyrate-2-oxoglutarate transaminase